MNRTYYGKEELLKEFEEIGTNIASPVSVYLFGGGAMAFRNQKPATKDLDLVFLSKDNYDEFTRALEKSGFVKVKVVEKPYVEMEASSIWEKQDGFRLDLFVKVICKKLEISESMAQRSENFNVFGNLAVNLLSNEDIILLKGITERDRDEEDIAIMLRSSAIDWQIILNECTSQSKSYAWYAAVFNKFFKIKEKYGIASPILDVLEVRANRALLVQFYKDKLSEGKTHAEIIQKLKKEGFTANEISQLEKNLKNVQKA